MRKLLSILIVLFMALSDSVIYAEVDLQTEPETAENYTLEDFAETEEFQKEELNHSETEIQNAEDFEEKVIEEADSNAQEDESVSEQKEIIDEAEQSESDPEWFEDSWTNPYYADCYIEDSINQPFTFSAENSRRAPSESVEAAANYLSEQMSQRNESISLAVNIPASSAASWKSLARTILDTAFSHTGDPKHGDYIYWNFFHASWRYPGGDPEDEYFNGTISYTVQYNTTKEQENAFDERITEVLPALDVGSGTEVEKATAIYAWLCNNVVYDYEHLGDKSYRLQFTAYAALFHGTSVCQGYALLFYRMALEMGLDARIITGGNHAWNIVGIGSEYYLCDTTWDSSRYCAKNYIYFLRGEPNFGGHTTESKYTTEPFCSEYPLSQTNLSYPENLKKEAQRIYIVPSSVQVNGLSETATAEIVVEPNDAYDKSFNNPKRNNTNFSLTYRYDSKIGKNYGSIQKLVYND